MLTNINHIGIAVTDLEQATHFWRDVLGVPLEKKEHVAQEAVDIAFLPIRETEIELLAPTAPNGVTKFLEKRGAGIHHICFEVNDIKSALAHLTQANVPLIHDTPQIRHDGIKYAFIHPKGTGGVLIELYQLVQQRDVAPRLVL